MATNEQGEKNLTFHPETEGKETEKLADFSLAHAEFDTEAYKKLEKARLDNYSTHWKYYDGEMRKFLKNKKGQPNDNVTVNLCAVLIDRTNSRLFGDATRGEMLTFDVESKEEEQAKYIAQHEKTPTPLDKNKKVEAEAHGYLKGIWDRSGGLETIYNNTGVYGGVTGHFAFKVTVEEEGPRVVVLDPGILGVLTAEDDKDKVRSYKIEYQVFRRDPSDPNERIKEATFRQLLLNGDYYGTAGMWHIQDFISFKKTQRDPDWTPVSPEDSMSFCPIVDGQNLPHARDYFGMSDLHNVIELNDEINFILSNVNRIIRYHAHPRTIGLGVDPSTIQETNVESFWSVAATPDEAKIYNLEMDSDLDATFGFFQIIREAFWTIGREADPAVFKDKIGNVTNFGLRVLYLDALNKLGQKRQTYGKAFRSLGEKLMELSDENFENLTLVPKWADPLPSDPREQVETMMMEKDMGILSKETAAKSRGRNWAEERQRILDEMKDESSFGERFLGALRGESAGAPQDRSLNRMEGSKGGRP